MTSRGFIDSPVPSAWPRTLSVMAVTTFAVAKHIQYAAWHFEDGYIVYRIARNVVEGHGWAFNAGEVHNASTSVLNTLLLVCGGMAGVAMPTMGHLIGTTSLLATGLLLTGLLLPVAGRPLATLAAILSMEVVASSLTWGIETHLFIALATLAVWVDVRNRNPWPVLGLLTLARPDGLLLAAGVWLRRVLMRRDLSLAGLSQYVLVLAPWVIFSLVRFGQIFPDTLGNKVWQGRSGLWGVGWIYADAIWQHLLLRDTLAPARPFMTAVVVLAPFGVALLAMHRSLLLALPLFGLAQQGIYAMLNVPAYHWYFAFLDYGMTVAAAYAMGWLWTRTPGLPRRIVEPAGTAALSVILVACVVHAFRAPALALHETGNRHYLEAVETIDALDLPPGDLAAAEVGTLGWGIRRPIVDLVGLTSPNPEYLTGTHNRDFFERAPLIVVLHDPPWPPALHADPRFAFVYGDGHPTGRSPAATGPALRYYVRQRSVGGMSEACDMQPDRALACESSHYERLGEARTEDVCTFLCAAASAAACEWDARGGECWRDTGRNCGFREVPGWSAGSCRVLEGEGAPIE